jgi:putative flavoprotein involved in K+ transport
MRSTDVIIIGGGQSGLVMSKSLSARGIDHLVVERGRTGEAWLSARWDSLHLLTCNAQSALPGMPHDGDPEAFMPARRFASYLEAYAGRFAVPILNGIEVRAVERACHGFRVTTTAGEFLARAVIVATGACDTPYRPECAAMLSPSLFQLNPSDYRAPAQLPEGGVLIVGASSTGVQLAEEIHASGRAVTLSVGDHTRVPRRYRGRDIYAWMETTGMLDDPVLENGNLEAARRQPSLQLVGRPDRRDLNLKILQQQGVRLVGRLLDLGGCRAFFAADLLSTTAAAHRRMLRVLDRIDSTIRTYGFLLPDADPGERQPFLAATGTDRLDLRAQGIRTVIWATGYRRRYPWLKVPVLDDEGEIIHKGGLTSMPGLYVLGLTFLRRRRSSFIDGCGLDAEDLAPSIEAHLSMITRRAAA